MRTQGQQPGIPTETVPAVAPVSGRCPAGDPGVARRAEPGDILFIDGAGMSGLPRTHPGR